MYRAVNRLREFVYLSAGGCASVLLEDDGLAG